MNTILPSLDRKRNQTSENRLTCLDMKLVRDRSTSCLVHLPLAYCHELALKKNSKPNLVISRNAEKE